MVAVVEPGRIRENGVRHAELLCALIHPGNESALSAGVRAGERMRGAVVARHECGLEEGFAGNPHAVRHLGAGGRADVVLARDAHLFIETEVALGNHERRHELRDGGDGKRHVGVLHDEFFARILIHHISHGATEHQGILSFSQARQRCLRRRHAGAVNLRALHGTLFLNGNRLRRGSLAVDGGLLRRCLCRRRLGGLCRLCGSLHRLSVRRGRLSRKRRTGSVGCGSGRKNQMLEGKTHVPMPIDPRDGWPEPKR